MTMAVTVIEAVGAHPDFFSSGRPVAPVAHHRCRCLCRHGLPARDAETAPNHSLSSARYGTPGFARRSRSPIEDPAKPHNVASRPLFALTPGNPKPLHFE